MSENNHIVPILLSSINKYKLNEKIMSVKCLPYLTYLTPPGA